MKDRRGSPLFKHPVIGLESSPGMFGHFLSVTVSLSGVLWKVLRSDVLPLCFC